MKSVIKKAVKKLKFWSNKRSSRGKNKYTALLHDVYYTPPPPPPPCHYHGCSSSYSTQPSAPPLPDASNSWLETEHKYSNINYGTFLDPPEIAPMPMDPSPGGDQYSVSVSEPAAVVYGIPVVPLLETPRSKSRSRSTRGRSSVLTFGSYLFQCLCPCFHSHERS